MRNAIIIFFLIIGVAVQSQERAKIGLVLSGGGAKGIAHIGVIKELEKRGIKPDYITGTSMGALIGGLYAVGYSPDELEEIIKSSDWDYLLNDEIKRENYLIGQGNKDKNSIITLPLKGFKFEPVSGLFEGQNVLTLIELLTREYNRDIDFDSLPIPFKCIGTNIETGYVKVFESGKLADAMRASMSIPSVFSPYEIDGELYVDGGLVNNFPTDIIKQMGADIIIGVDVGAVLYKKEEISSIIRILDQSSSFYNARVSAENKKICDVYIRPDIDGMSALDFSNAISIIDLGVKATIKKSTQIDSVFKEIKLSPIVNINTTLLENIFIDTIIIKINGDKERNLNTVYGLVNGKLDVKTPCTINEEEFSKKINRLYGSRFFKKISTNFYPSPTGYVVEITVDEKQDDEFNIGVRYDNYYGINVLLGANFRNKLFYGSLLELRLVAGQNPQLKLRYTTDRGSSLGFGTSFQFDNFFVYTYENTEQYIKYNYNRAVWDIFIHEYLNSFNRVFIGFEGSLYGLTSTQNITQFDESFDTYMRLYGAFVHDTWDRAYFPNKGIRAKGRADLTQQHKGPMFVNAWLKVKSIIPISKRIKLGTKGFVGYGSSAVDTTLFKYMIGGIERNRVQWYNSIPGLNFLEKGSSNIWLLSVVPRWEFVENNFITYNFSIVAIDQIFEKLFYDPSEFYSGMSLQYAYYSMFGPMSLTVDYSPKRNKFGMLLSLGYWF